MCALYWQLNDVWAAPTWSSVDFDLRWKMAHHFVRRAFAPLLISMVKTAAGWYKVKPFLFSIFSILTRPNRSAYLWSPI
jgi:beta-galactosidase/beta-glucuronidase